jgi:hypothetical protein
VTSASPEAGVDFRAMSLDDWRNLLQSTPTVSLWPTAAAALTISRPVAYRCAGDSIPVLRLGRSLRVSSVWLARALQLELDGRQGCTCGQKQTGEEA